MDIFARIVIYLIISVIIFGIILGIGSCLEDMGEKNVGKNARREIYNARFPKVGDKIELDGKEIVILKQYFWAQDRRYQVRLENGNITDVMGSEIIDKKPIGAEEDG